VAETMTKAGTYQLAAMYAEDEIATLADVFAE
jgi:hypothetical protein